MVDRRRFLVSLGALAVSPAFAQATSPFALGVASGYPTASGVVLWTRLLGASSPAALEVAWEISADDAIKAIVRSGKTLAGAEWAHSVHVEAQGLEPDRW